MKKIISTLAAIAITFSTSVFFPVSAQTPEVPIKRESQSFYYLEVSEVTLGVLNHAVSMKKSININYGKEAPTATAYKIADEQETGLVKFENVLGALNYLGAQGWEIISTYKRDNNNSGQLCYLLRLDISKHNPTVLTKAIDDMLGELTIQKVE